MKPTPWLQLTAALFLAATLSNCAFQKSVQTAEPTGFQKTSGVGGSNKIARLPFDHSWRDPKMNPAQYTKVVIRPVSLSYLRKEQWKDSASAQVTSQATYLEYVNQVAKHWDKALQQAFRAPENRLRPVGQTGAPGTLIFEIAMTEVVFGHPETYLASFAVAGGGVVDAAMFAPSVAFEARVTDAATGKVVATASDRRGTKIKALDLNRLHITKPNLEICDEWSQQIMQAFNKELFPTVKRSWVSVF